MSYEIEYNKKIYKDESKDKSEPDYLLLIRQGSNNCREANGQRVKDWELISYGWNFQIIAEICQRAGDCEGGSIQKAKGYEAEQISPEDYLAMYRDKIKQAKPIENLLKDFRVEIMLSRKEKFNEKEKKAMSWQIEKIDKMLEKYKTNYQVGKDYYSPEIKTYRAEILNLKQFYEFLECPRWRDNSICYCSWIFTLNQNKTI